MGDSMSTIINATTTNGVVIQPDNSGSLVLQTNNGTTALTISTAQNATFAAQATIPTINLTGGQIVFPATQSASANANTLDDYEEGTFTPFIRGNTTAGTASYTRQIGIYTKIGNRVFFTISIEWSSGTGTGALTIGGLPFTQNGDGNDLPYAISESGNVAWDANYFPTPAGGNNTTIIYLNTSRVGASGVSLNTNYDAAGYVSMSGHYKI
jgi:hypothetical protein